MHLWMSVKCKGDLVTQPTRTLNQFGDLYSLLCNCHRAKTKNDLKVLSRMR